MANSKSALKRVRQIKKRTARNRVVKTNVKETRKALLDAVESGDAAEAKKALSALASAADIATKNNILHTNQAANIKAKASAKVKALG